MTKFLIQRKKPIVVSFILTALISIVLSLGVSINYNIADYLPKDSKSTKALDIMNEEFETLVANGQVMISNSSISNALYFKEELAQINGISSVIWLDDIINILEPIEIADQEIVEQYLKNENALISITVDNGQDSKVLEKIYQLIGEDNAVSGDFVDTATQKTMAVKETTRAMMIAVPIIIIILLITTSSWIEPVLFLLTIGISVVINMGTNIF
ncbi:MAG TPA: MMPL family transporter, partial [Clostridiales bacterium]|nr:MMPL family transporter [Clostridiales bacterium]